MPAKTRSGRTKGSAGDQYLHAILLLTDKGRQAETTDVAEKVGVSPAAASKMVQRLAGKKLVVLEPYQGARLTHEGLHRALRVVRRHRLLEIFLHEVLGFDLRECHMRAASMQGTVDQTFEDRLDEFLGHPQHDPHGNPIPTRNAVWPKVADSPLLELPPGTEGKLSRIATDDPAMLSYLRKLGLRLGVRMVFESVAPFEGPVSLRLAGGPVHVARRVAEVLYLRDDSAVVGSA
jgi:DtxR family transcriptional regulator, Mn-dependent transcriptional regulator